MPDICPNILDDKWKSLVDHLKTKFGEDAEEAAHFAFHEKGTGEIPSIEEADNIFEESEKRSPIGMSIEEQRKRAASLGITEPERLSGKSTQQLVEEGNKLRQEGANPEEIANQFVKDGRISTNDMLVLFSFGDELVRRTDEVAAEKGRNSKEYKEALQKENEWKENIINPIANLFNKIGLRLQGLTDEFGNFEGMSRAFKRITGKDFTPKQEETAKQLSEGIQEIDKGIKDATDKIIAEINAAEKKYGKSTQSSAGGDIHTKFANKKGDDFTVQEVREIWNYAKENYIDKGANDFKNMIKNIATDLGLTYNQVQVAISKPKSARVITDEMYKLMSRRRIAIAKAKQFVYTANQPVLKKFFKFLPSAWFGLRTFGHGTVGFITHAGTNLFMPSKWNLYFKNAAKQFKFVLNTAAYEQAMQALENDKDFTFWKRSGLAVDPKIEYTEYDAIGRFLNVGKSIESLMKAGDRGFAALKVYRLDLAKSFYDGLSDAEKADPNTAKEIAKLVNHSTGATEVKFNDFFQTAFFSPKLEASRWQGLITDPAKAINYLSKGSNMTASEKVFVKLQSRKAGEIIATYTALLAANAGILKAVNSDDEINFTDPSKSDWLKFKVKGKTLDFTGGMLGTMRFIYSLGQTVYSAYNEKSKGFKSPGQKELEEVGTQLRYKEAPFAAMLTDFLVGTDAMGKPLPGSKVKAKRGEKPYTISEYYFQQVLPIPALEYLRESTQSMRDRGMSDKDMKAILSGALSGAVSGITGVKLGEEPKKKSSSVRY
jgi:hypothetical protein